MQGYLGRYLPGSPGTETGLKRLGTTCVPKYLSCPSFPPSIRYTYTAQHHCVHNTHFLRCTPTLLPPVRCYIQLPLDRTLLAPWPCLLSRWAVTATYARECHAHPQILERIVNLLCNTDAGTSRRNDLSVFHDIFDHGRYRSFQPPFQCAFLFFVVRRRSMRLFPIKRQRLRTLEFRDCLPHKELSSSRTAGLSSRKGPSCLGLARKEKVHLLTSAWAGISSGRHS